MINRKTMILAHATYALVMSFTYILGLNREVLSVILAVAVAIFTVLGGVGGAMYVGYFVCVLALGVAMVFVIEVLFDPWERHDVTGPFQSWEVLYRHVKCYDVGAEVENDGNSALTFLSKGGMTEGVVLILSESAK